MLQVKEATCPMVKVTGSSASLAASRPPLPSKLAQTLARPGGLTGPCWALLGPNVNVNQCTAPHVPGETPARESPFNAVHPPRGHWALLAL